MPTPQELEAELWKSLKSDMTVMLGLDGGEDGHTRPMTAQIEDERGPIWFFTSKDAGLYRKLDRQGRAIATFVSKRHDLFATIHGGIRRDEDRAVVERFWNPFIAAWYEGGKNDPNLALLRLDAEKAEIWQDTSNILSGIKMLFGVDPKKDYKDKVATVRLS